MSLWKKIGETGLSPTLRDRRKWFPDTSTLGVQVVDRRNTLQKFSENTWVVSVERFLSLLD